MKFLLLSKTSLPIYSEAEGRNPSPKTTGPPVFLFRLGMAIKASAPPSSVLGERNLQIRAGPLTNCPP